MSTVASEGWGATSGLLRLQETNDSSSVSDNMNGMRKSFFMVLAGLGETMALRIVLPCSRRRLAAGFSSKIPPPGGCQMLLDGLDSGGLAGRNPLNKRNKNIIGSQILRPLFGYFRPLF
jgi:hypothetical protein